MAQFEKTQVVTVDEDDLGRAVRFYDGTKSDGTAVACVTINVPGAQPFDGLVSDIWPLAADRTSLRGLLVKGIRKVFANQGMTVKP